MNTGVQIRGYREDTNGTDLIIHIPDRRLGDMLQRKRIKEAELRLDDGRHISSAQRKKIYATVRDIADFTGYLPEEEKEWMNTCISYGLEGNILAFPHALWIQQENLSIPSWNMS